MKYFLFVLTVSVSFSTFAGGTIPLAKVEEYVQKKQPCDLAVVHILKGEKAKNLGCSGDCTPDDRIYCVQDSVIGKGLQEKSGCALTGYYLNQDRYGTLSGRYYIVEGKSCASGGFEELMKREYGAIGSIETLLTSEIGGMVYPTVLPSRNSSYANRIKEKIKKNQ